MRNNSIDILKFVCAVFVVFLHVPTPIHYYYLPLLRCAVPTFLIISGYFMYDSAKMDARLTKAIKHIAKICLWATLLYIVIVILRRHGDLHILSKQLLFNWAIFNATPFGYHLWYLFAYLYTLVIVCFLSRHNFLRILYIATPILLAADLVFGKYSLLIFGKEFPYIWVRNFICVGIPYFTVGMLLKKYKDKILKINILYPLWGG